MSLWYFLYFCEEYHYWKNMKRIFLYMMLMAAFCGTAEARKVKGTVMSGENKLEGVIVTDGKSFTQTDKKGRFTFDIVDDAEFVYIVTPAGYVADWTSGVPAFYKPAAGCTEFNFQLQRTAGGMDYHIVAIADPQTYTDEHFAMFAGAPMTDLAATSKSLDGVAIGLALGDISWDRIEILDMYKKEIVRTGIPFYPVMGNHDNEAYRVGDKEAAAAYRSKMGPENYALRLGRDVVIVLDDIIYDTNFKSTNGYTDEIIDWVRGLVKLIPADSEIYVAQHAPLTSGPRRIQNANRLLDILRGRKVTFISGHTHRNANTTIERNITEHNVAAICGTWWDAYHCTDGTPRGYKVFTKHGGRLSWYYKPVGQSNKYIAEAFSLGEGAMYPSSVFVNVWDWDPEWKVEWYEDGVHRGSMDRVREISPSYMHEAIDYYKRTGEEIPELSKFPRNNHTFAAMPSRYAKNVTITVESRFGQKWMQAFNLEDYIEQHIACPAGASVEEIKALVNRGANTIRFNAFVERNGDVKIGGKDGAMMGEVLDAVEGYVAESGRSQVRYNLVIDTAHGREEGKTVPYYHDYIDYLMVDLWPRYLGERLMVTGNDYRSLNHLAEKYPEVDIAFNVTPETGDVTKAMARLKFTPKWMAVHYTLVDEAFIETCRSKGQYVSVWGIPDAETLARIKALSPDAVEIAY